MAILSAEDHFTLLNRAEMQFKLMMAVRTACTLGQQSLRVPIRFKFGNRQLSGEDMTLTPDQADEAAAVLEHTATYTLALQITQALKDVFRNPREHSDAAVSASFEIARLVRNAYAHQPFRPHWSIDPSCARKTFEVPGIVRLDTTSLDGTPVRWQDYGGMVALFRLSQLARSLVLPSAPNEFASALARESAGQIPALRPGDVEQFGRLLFVVLDRLPNGCVPFTMEGSSAFDTPDGTYTFRL